MSLKHLILIALVSTACAGGESRTTGGAESTSTHTGTHESSSSSSEATSSTNPTMASDSLSDTTPAETSSSEGESSSTAAESSSGDPCPVGTLGCPCDVGACASDLACVDDVCEAIENCAVDGYEPNESEDAAVYLGVLGDGDDPGSIAATLDHADDVDWFTYDGEDNVGLPPGVAPSRDLSASAGLRLCKFLECPDGIEVTEVMCPNGSDLAQSPSGRPGCCSTGSIMMPDFNCSGGTDDSAFVYIRLDMAEAQCVDYTVGYEY
jgi:hypothetical protein